jgi:hypothetical protein
MQEQVDLQRPQVLQKVHKMLERATEPINRPVGLIVVAGGVRRIALRSGSHHPRVSVYAQRLAEKGIDLSTASTRNVAGHGVERRNLEISSPGARRVRGCVPCLEQSPRRRVWRPLWFEPPWHPARNRPQRYRGWIGRDSARGRTGGFDRGSSCQNIRSADAIEGGDFSRTHRLG